MQPHCPAEPGRHARHRLNPNANGAVHAIAVQADGIGGQARNRIAQAIREK
jgi:hypothetical protein